MRDKGFGVDCVWMNMVLLCPVENRRNGRGEAEEEEKAAAALGARNDGVAAARRRGMKTRELLFLFVSDCANLTNRRRTLPQPLVIVSDSVLVLISIEN